MNLLRGLAVQFRVLQALVLRETRTRFGSYQLGYLWALIEPTLWIGAFFGMFYLMNRPAPYGMDLVGFLATGIVPYQLFQSVANRASGAIGSNKALLFYPQVRPLDVVLARCYLEVITLTLVFILILGANALVQGTLVIDDLFQVMAGLALGGALGASFGLVLAGISVYTQILDRVKTVLFRPLFWTSGLFFTVNSLPRQAREVVLWNPVAHCVDLIRGGWFVSYEAYHINLSYVYGWILTCSFLGLTLERVARRRIQVT